MTKNASDVAKFAPIAGWVGQTAEGEPYTINNRELAKTIAGLTTEDYPDEAVNNALFARTTAVDTLKTRVDTQESKVTSLESSVTPAALKEKLITEEEGGTVPLLDMLTASAYNSENTDALLLRALTTNDETSEQPLLSNALVFEVSEKDGGEKVPLVLSLKKEGETILASQTDYTKLSSNYSTLDSNYSTLNSNYSTLETTVGSLYGDGGLFALDNADNTLSLNTTVFSDKMADAITTAKGGGQCSDGFKPNALTTALTLDTCKTSSTSE